MPENALDPKTTALVLIDLERGIVGGDLAPRSGTAVVGAAATLAQAFREKGATVVYAHVLLHEMLAREIDQPMPSQGTPPPSASELVPEAEYREGDLLVTKRSWGAFYGTSLDQLLRRRGISTIVLGGIATNLGVESTARGAYDRGYGLVFAEDAMASVSEAMHRFAVESIFPSMGRVRRVDEIVAMLA